MQTNRLVETDAYDRDACARALLRTPEARRLVERGRRVLPHFGALLEDLFAIAFGREVCLREGPPSTALNHRLLSVVARSPGVVALHESCSLDEIRSASVALALGRATLAEVKKGELFTDEELLDQAALALAEERVAALEATRSMLSPKGEAKQNGRFLREAHVREAAWPPARATDGQASSPSAARLLARVDAELSSLADRRDELAERVRRTLSSLPTGLEARLERVAANIAETLDDEEEVARAFADAVGARGPLSVSDRVILADRLRSSEKLRKLAPLAGAFRREALAARKRRIRRAPTERHRVGRGSELSRLLPAELAGLPPGARRLLFLRRLAERDLAQYELAGADRGGKGPLIVCVDGSRGMSGPRELWAKAVTLALLELARRQDRRAEAILFSGRESPLSRFSLLSRRHHGAGGRRLVSLPEILDFASTFPGGGTDFEKPLGAALDLLQTIDLKGGHIVFVTSGEARISEELALDLARLKNQLDFAIHAVLIDDPWPASGQRSTGGEADRARRELGKVADRITTVTRLTPGAVTELFERT